jgi:phosphate:Na+ symporter
MELTPLLFFGALALLLYAMGELSKALQTLAGPQLRSWVGAFVQHRFGSLLLGLVPAALVQSSVAVNVLLAALANARMLPAEQALPAMLGAGIGSTFIVFFFSVRLAYFGLALLAIGVLVERLANRDLQVGARVLTYMGLFFYALAMLADAARTFEQNELFRYVVQYFHDRPVYSFLIAAVMTMLVHSSAAALAMVISIAEVRNVDIAFALPWIFGANVGSVAAAVLSSGAEGGPRGPGVLGRQVVLGNLAVKVATVLVLAPFGEPVAALLRRLTDGVGTQVALGHLGFNIVAALGALPFLGLVNRFVRRWMRPDGDDQFRFHHLDERTLGAPELAIAQASREILRLADTVERMVDRSLRLFDETRAGSFETELESIRSMDQLVDFLNRGVKLYLTKLSTNSMTAQQSQREFQLLLRTNDLENIGDIIDRNVLPLARKKRLRGYRFSDAGWSELKQLHGKVVDCVRASNAFFASGDRDLHVRILVLYGEIEDLCLVLGERHVRRLHDGIRETLDTTSVHWDLIGYYQRVAALAVNICRIVDLQEPAA